MKYKDDGSKSHFNDQVVKKRKTILKLLNPLTTNMNQLGWKKVFPNFEKKNFHKRVIQRTLKMFPVILYSTQTKKLG